MICPSELEVWKPIPGYDGLYEASSMGRIRTAVGKVTSSARFPHRVWKQRVMKQKWIKRRNSTKSDARICLWKDGVEKTFLVARLIAMTFSPVYCEELTVNHIDGNPENNNIDNLEWVTRAENNRLGYETGLFKSLQKPITLIDEFGNHTEFVSQAEASRFLDRNNGYVNCVLGRGGKCAVAKNGTKYRVLVT